jgi:hypothetical protein
MSQPVVTTNRTHIRTCAIESIPTSWDDPRDTTFFRCTAQLFTPAFTLGATVLLASNDNLEMDTV